MSTRSPDNKELTFPLLRSFCETARLGSMSAAAEALGLSQPTIWKQIHSLEKHFGVKLVEPHTRGCRLTAAGEALLRQSFPLISEFGRMSQKFQAEIDQQYRQLRVAAPPRPCEEELLPCIAEFEKRYPRVRISLMQALTLKGVTEAVRSGSADVGITPHRPRHAQSQLGAEKIYDLEFVLLVPPGHPLATTRVRLEHFANYPLLNSRKSCVDRKLVAALDSVGAFHHPERRMEIFYHRTVRLYARHGFGIGIVPRPVGMKLEEDGIVERPLTSFLRSRLPVYAIYGRSVSADSDLLTFVEVVREKLSR